MRSHAACFRNQCPLVSSSSRGHATSSSSGGHSVGVRRGNPRRLTCSSPLSLSGASWPRGVPILSRLTARIVQRWSVIGRRLTSRRLTSRIVQRRECSGRASLVFPTRDGCFFNTVKSHLLPVTSIPHCQQSKYVRQQPTFQEPV